MTLFLPPRPLSRARVGVVGPVVLASRIYFSRVFCGCFLLLCFFPSFPLAFAVRIDGSRIHVRVGSARDPNLHRSGALMRL